MYCSNFNLDVSHDQQYNSHRVVQSSISVSGCYKNFQINNNIFFFRNTNIFLKNTTLKCQKICCIKQRIIIIAVFPTVHCVCNTYIPQSLKLLAELGPEGKWIL